LVVLSNHEENIKIIITPPN